METIKTTVVVASLLGVLYGVYTILNQQPGAPQTEVATAFDEGFELDIDFDAPGFEEPPAPQSAPGAELQPPALDGYPSPEVSVDGADAPTLSSSGAEEQALAPFSPPVTETEIPHATLGAVDAPSPAATPTLEADALAPENEPVPPVPMATPVDPEGQAAPSNIAAPPAVDTAATATNDGISAPPTVSNPPILNDAPEAGPSPDPTAPQLAPSPAELAGAAAAASGAELSPFQRARRTAKAQMDGGQHKDALFTLSLFYGDPALSEQERTELLDLLDPLAGRVIYSREHLLTSAHVTTQGESIEEIAAKYQVPAQLLININGIQRPDAMTSGMQLKVVPGPFRAEIDTQRNEMTLFLRRMYAGRFPVSIGNDPTPRPGEYTLKEKSEGQTFYGEGGQSIPAEAPNNPYGGHWINLGGITIHGSPQQPNGISRGCVSLSPRDAADVYHILSVGSKVVVK